MASRPSGSGRFSWLLERWLVPIVLVLVGLLQICLAHTAELSPWKGGGFGMFAAIDSPSMRVLATEGLDQNGQLLRLDLLEALDESASYQISALPKRAYLEQLAPQLISREIVPIAIRRRAAYEKLQTENPAIKFQFSESLLLNQPVYRLRIPTDPALTNGLVKKLQAIRLQWWRLRFDPSQKRLWAESLSQVVEAGIWK